MKVHIQIHRVHQLFPFIIEIEYNIQMRDDAHSLCSISEGTKINSCRIVNKCAVLNNFIWLQINANRVNLR